MSRICKPPQLNLSKSKQKTTNQPNSDSKVPDKSKTIY